MQASKTKTERVIWKIDATHTAVAFSVRNFFFFKVRGGLENVAGAVVLDEEDIRHSTVAATIKGASITTGNIRRDAHLRAADFLDVERYPDILFKSIRVEAGTDRDTFNVVGELTIRDKSREITLSANAVDRSCSPQGEEVVYYTAMTQLDRFDFGITYLRGVIGRKLEIVINVQATKQN
jgi:polyisoprenoid-binding protein YceI